MAKPREKVRNGLLHNYDTATNLASKVTVSIFTHPRYTNSLGQFPHKGTHIHLPEVRNHACTRLKARYDEKGNSHFLLAYIPTDILQRDLDRLLAGLRAPTPVKLKDLQAPRLETKAI